MAKKIELLGLESIPNVNPGDSLVDYIIQALHRENVKLDTGDILVISSKVVSKAEGRIVDLEDIKPGKAAKAIAKLTGKDSRRVQVIKEESSKIVGYLSLEKLSKNRDFIKSYFGEDDVEKILALNEAVLFSVMPGGQIMTDAGTDFSNVEGKNMMSLLPKDPMQSAGNLRKEIEKKQENSIGVVISDTEIRALRQGTTDIALGYDGVVPMMKEFGEEDLFGSPTFGGIDAIADQMASSASLLMGQCAEKIPVVILKGLDRFFDPENLMKEETALPFHLMASFMKDVIISRFKLSLYTRFG